MTPDKRDECGCHRECSTAPHECERPCRWPDCLTEAEHAELLQSVHECCEVGAVKCPDPQCPASPLRGNAWEMSGTERHWSGQR